MADDFDYDPNSDEEQEDLEQEAESAEEENQEEEEQAAAQARQQQVVQKRITNNRLKEIAKTAPFRFYPHLTHQEQRFLRKMKNKGHATEVQAIQTTVGFRQQIFKTRIQGILTASIIPMLIFGLLLLLFIFVCVIVWYLFPFLRWILFPGVSDSSGGSSSGAASPFGIKGDKFYGARAVYKDETLSRNGLIEQYVDIVATNVKNLQSKTYTEIVEVDGENKTFEVKVTIDLTKLKLPDEEFDFEKLDLTTFAEDYAVIYNIVEDMAKLSYEVDNPDLEVPADLVETLDGIKYFGFNEDMIGSSIVDEDKDNDNNIIEIVYDALTEDGVIVLEEKLQSESDYQNATNVTMENFDDNLREELISYINVEKNKLRTEKLFIRDFILTGNDKYMEGIEKHNYVALIYLPKESVNFSYVSYMITIDKTANFSMILTNNGSVIALSKDDGENWGDESLQELTYIHKSSDNLSQTANVTDIIDVDYLDKFTSGSSLVNVVSDENVDYNVYLEEIIDENGEKVLTYKNGSMYITFESDFEFYFNDEMTY